MNSIILNNDKVSISKPITGDPFPKTTVLNDANSNDGKLLCVTNTKKDVHLVNKIKQLDKYLLLNPIILR